VPPPRSTPRSTRCSVAQYSTSNSALYTVFSSELGQRHACLLSTAFGAR
jgi:hypothetical protein